MGDRAIIHFTDGATIGPAVYLHLDGHKVGELLEELTVLMADRIGDVEYTTARFIGIIHTTRPGNLSLGTRNAPAGGLKSVMSSDYSPGDFGVIVVDCLDWTYYHHGGYGLTLSNPTSRLQPKDDTI